MRTKKVPFMSSTNYLTKAKLCKEPSKSDKFNLFANSSANTAYNFLNFVMQSESFTE